MTTTVLDPMLEPVQWYDGMLLTPQHFQQNDLYWHRQQYYQRQQQHPYYWGVLQLQLNSALIEQGRVQIEALHAVLPDGFTVQVHSSDSQDSQADQLTRSIEDHPDLERQGWVRLHLVVPKRNLHIATDRSRVRRFSVVERVGVVDESAQDQHSISIMRLQPKLSLWPGDVAPKQYESIALCEVERTASGRFQLRHFHPPMLRLSASQFLQARGLDSLLKRLMVSIRAKADQLYSLQQIERLNLHTLTASLPALEIMLASGGAHPFSVYLQLANLYGQLCALSANPIPRTPSPYQHDHCVGQFFGLIKAIRQLLRSLQLSVKVYEFKPLGEHSFALMMRPGWAVEQFVIEIKPQPGQSLQAMENWLDQAQIGSQTLLPTLSRLRSPGAWSQRLNEQQRFQYTHRADAMLFEIRNNRIKTDTGESAVIHPAQTLVITSDNTQLTPPKHILLYQPLTQAGDTP